MTDVSHGGKLWNDVLFLQEYRNKELNNGRLAMIAAAGITVQEKFVTGGLPEFEIHRFGLSDLATDEIGRIPGAL